jgi:hypothetical protein
MSASEAFFAPLTSMLPVSFFPPVITNLSTPYLKKIIFSAEINEYKRNLK